MHNFKLNLSYKADAWVNGGQLYLNFFLGKSVVKLKVLSLRIFYISSRLMLIFLPLCLLSWFLCFLYLSTVSFPLFSSLYLKFTLVIFLKNINLFSTESI